MFPIKDDIPARQFPYVNIGLIVFNVAVFIFEMGQGPHMEQFIMEYGFVPARFSSLSSWELLDLSRYGTVFSSMFLHGSLFHIISNMWILWIFGDNVEDCMGHGRYIFFFLLCGMASVLAQTVSAPASHLPMVGASGAISGVLGAYFLTYPKARVLTLIPIFILFYMVDLPAYVFLGLWFLMQLLSGYSTLAIDGAVSQGGVAWWAHVGGFGAGVILIRFFRQEKLLQTYNRSLTRIRRLRR
jgi:membrane associated rhomboid family serine protease